MARYLMTPFYRADGSDGGVLNGAKLYFYATGTTTPTDTYQASSGGSAHANPVVADSAGLFAPIYLDGATIYRAILKTSGGSTIQDIDPLNAAVVPGADTVSDTELTTGAAVANIGYTPVNKAGDTATDLRLAYGSTLYTDQAGTRTIPVTTLDSSTDLLETHTGGMVRHTSGSGHTWTIQPMATSGSTWVIGSTIVLRNIGSGTVTLARGSGVALRSAGSTTDANKSLAQWAFATIVMEANDTWVISGTGVS
jgi:hypothetical protein